MKTLLCSALVLVAVPCVSAQSSDPTDPEATPLQEFLEGRSPDIERLRETAERAARSPETRRLLDRLVSEVTDPDGLISDKVTELLRLGERLRPEPSLLDDLRERLRDETR